MKTPLHYAAQRSSTISSLYILQRGAQLESKDIYGNTPLGVALKNSHFDYGIILIQKCANVTMPVYEEYPKRIAKMWKDEEERIKKEEAKAASGDVEMEEEEEKGGRDSKKHRGLFTKNMGVSNAFFNMGYSSDEDSEESDDESSDDDGR